MMKLYRGMDALGDFLQRDEAAQKNVDDVVRAIIEDVRARGDAAVLDYTEKFDGVRPEALRVSPEELADAWNATDDDFKQTLSLAAENIRAYHALQIRRDYVKTDVPGAILGQRVLPMASAGLYIPGGTASYPSSVLMNAIPAKLAGVTRVALATPPCKDGRVSPAILAAAKVAGVDEIYKCGGAQAIAALAYGTESVPAVDKIVGPGNIYVATAKRMVYGQVAIDMIAGPSEILVVADAQSSPVCVAADLLGQAEHDKIARAMLVTDSEALALSVRAEVEKQLETLPRKVIARASIDDFGAALVVDTLEEALQAANAAAPEHLELCVDDPFALLPLVRNAGSVFLGRYAPEALGDYFAGPNHTLPTGGTARFSSPLSVDDFVKKMSFTYYTKEALQQDARRIADFARREGLDAHARSVEARV